MPKRGLASPAELEQLVRETCLDLLAIYPMYRRLHSLGLEPPKGDSVKVSGSGAELTETERIVDSTQAQRRRDYARWITAEVQKMASTAYKIRQGLERNVGPTAGFRQSRTLGSTAVVSMDELTESLDNQAQRLKAGME